MWDSISVGERGRGRGGSHSQASELRSSFVWLFKLGSPCPGDLLEQLPVPSYGCVCFSVLETEPKASHMTGLTEL